MSKGQISLDFLITILVVIITMSSMALIINSIENSQEEILLTNQLKQTANELSTTITASQVMQDTNFYSKIKIDNLIYKNNEFFPRIILNDTNLVVKEDISGKNMSHTAKFDKPAKIKISIKGNYLVIQSE